MKVCQFCGHEVGGVLDALGQRRSANLVLPSDQGVSGKIGRFVYWAPQREELLKKHQVPYRPCERMVGGSFRVYYKVPWLFHQAWLRRRREVSERVRKQGNSCFWEEPQFDEETMAFAAFRYHQRHLSYQACLTFWELGEGEQ